MGSFSPKKIESKITDEKLLRIKMNGCYVRYRDIIQNIHQTLPKSLDDAVKILTIVETWLNEGRFALGSKTYTLADVFFTTMLARL